MIWKDKKKKKIHDNLKPQQILFEIFRDLKPQLISFSLFEKPTKTPMMALMSVIFQISQSCEILYYLIN